MSTHRKFVWSVVAVATFALCALITPSLIARGGHGGGGHAGGYHGGGHHAYHPYRASQHHIAHHAQHRNGEHQVAHRDEHHNHHHHSWQHGGWGPGFWGGAALGYGLGGWGYDGGDTYVNNVDTNDDDGSDDDSSDDATNSSDDQTFATSTSNAGGFPTDDWPELGINTYAGEYGGTQGQVVVRVVPNSAAARAGIVAGDVILSLNGKPTASADAMDTIFDTANLKFTAEVWDARTGRKSTLSGTLDPSTPATTAPQKL